MESNIVECSLHIPENNNNNNNNDNDNNIQWMKIKEKISDNILFYIPFINKFKKHKIDTFEKAVYKTPLLMEDNRDSHMNILINQIYDKNSLLIYNTIPPQQKNDLKFHIDLTASNYTYAQLYFLCKINRIGFINNIDEKQLDFQLFGNNINNKNNSNSVDNNNKNNNKIYQSTIIQLKQKQQK